MASKIRQNHHEDCEAGINKQINLELYAAYTYLSMYTYFSRDELALHGFAKFFKASSDEERDHAIKLIDYQNTRGGKVKFHNIEPPVKTEWGTALEAVEASLELEKRVNQALLELSKMAADRVDPHLEDFIEENYLDEQVKAIKELGDLITKMKRAGDGIGLHFLDKEFIKKFK